MKIKNVIRSSKISPNPPSNFPSWIDYWKDYHTWWTSITFDVLAEYGYKCPMCGKLVPLNLVVGGHVQKVDSEDKHWYIYPICDSCNKQPGKVSVEDITEAWLVPMPSNLP